MKSDQVNYAVVIDGEKFAMNGWGGMWTAATMRSARTFAKELAVHVQCKCKAVKVRSRLEVLSN